MIWRLLHLVVVVAGGVQLYTWARGAAWWVWQRLNEYVFQDRP